MKRAFKIVIGLVILGVLGLGGYGVLLAYKLGLFESHKMVKYNASNDANLQALRKAFMAYHESEGQFPDSPKWMDEVKLRIREGDMEKSETAKKLINPLYPAKLGVYGYAMNDAVSGKYKGDLKPSTILVFDSSDTEWNAHGVPTKLKPPNPSRGGDEGITIDGKIVKL